MHIWVAFFCLLWSLFQTQICRSPVTLSIHLDIWILESRISKVYVNSMLDFQKAVGSFYIPPAISIGVTYFAISKLILFCFSYIGSHLKECSIAPHCSFVGNSFLEHLTCLCIHSWSYLYIICHQSTIFRRCSVNFFLLFWISEFCSCWGWGLPYILGNDTLWNTRCENISSLGKLSFLFNILWYRNINLDKIHFFFYSLCLRTQIWESTLRSIVVNLFLMTSLKSSFWYFYSFSSYI